MLQTDFTGGAGLDERLQIPFRLQDSPIADNLRNDLLALDACHSNRSLFELAIAAAFNEKTDWLKSAIESDKQSDRAWRRKRAIVLEGFLSGNHLPVEGAWPAGEISGGYEHLRRRGARYRFVEACAHHWWRAYLAATTTVEAYASWTLFLRCADRRAWVWMGIDGDAADIPGANLHWKMSHLRLNQGKLKNAMSTRETNLDDRFLDLEIRVHVGPWPEHSNED